ncbi:antitoxin VbhA family protein [Bifidobacterium sp. ESL0790]|uniref:antitoxin VbhA family protein n=1 Tax=Bifidobacterium sp. ESL0790 TaxID=2983233 RepID=UPI0023F7DAE2|nr:antitoxin VbhA family protein [Bifidobacterium sp. ESL0790]WEV73049.1 antitoxin VbhA family protein [Bifidobacterium sp. ESL0790]
MTPVEKRAEDVYQAVYSTELAGQHVDEQFMADANEYISGNINIDEFGRRVEDRVR